MGGVVFENRSGWEGLFSVRPSVLFFLMLNTQFSVNRGENQIQAHCSSLEKNTAQNIKKQRKKTPIILAKYYFHFDVFRTMRF